MEYNTINKSKIFNKILNSINSLTESMNEVTKEMQNFLEEERKIDKQRAIEFLSNYKKVLSKIDKQYWEELKELLNGSYNSHVGYLHKKLLKLEPFKLFPYPSNDVYSVIKDSDLEILNSTLNRLSGLGLEFLRFDIDENFHYLVHQVPGVCEDDYSGYLLFPLNDDTYWVISFSE